MGKTPFNKLWPLLDKRAKLDLRFTKAVSWIVCSIQKQSSTIFLNQMISSYLNLNLVVSGYSNKNSHQGFCCSYLIFISENLSVVFHGISKEEWIALILPPVFLLTLVPDLSKLAIFSFFAQVRI